MHSKELVTLLKRHVEGDVRADLMTQQIYSVDASIFEIPPAAVVLPKNKEDLVAIVQIAQECNVPITSRGGGTGIAGGCLGQGVVVDTSKYLTRILEFYPNEKYAVCEPGVIQDQLNQRAQKYGLCLGADTSTGNRATIGGMCATNAAGSHYLKYGNMIDHVLGVEMILSTAEKVYLSEGSSWPNLPEVVSPPTFHRSSSGYPLYTLLEQPRNLAKLTVGSEGTLGIFSEIKLKLSETLLKRSLAILPFPSLEESLKEVPGILQFKPTSLEVIDEHIIEMGRLSPLLKGRLDWLDFGTKACLIAEFEADTPPSFSHKQINLLKAADQESVWALRKAGLGLLLSRRSYSRAIAFIEDLAVPPEKLPNFVKELKELLPWEIGIYGHAGDGCLHMRPYINVTNPKEIDQIFYIMPQVADLVRRFGGVLTSEHGDGIIRSWLNPTFYGESIYQAMIQVKKAFDPFNLMNPGKIVEASQPREFVRPSRPIQISTFLDFTKEGGLHLAADLCNGNGECRKTTGLMCPSFHAYKDERHTTRARAQSLRAILNGRLPMEELTEKGLLDVLDYCLECKGCKKECPSQVDMAKMKMEVLYQYQEKHGYSLKSHLFGKYRLWASLGARFPSFSNWFMQTVLTKKSLPLIGITPHRPLPKLALERFSIWWNKRDIVKKGKKVRLFIDTFTEYHCPEVGQAAVLLLEKNGFSVDPITHLCCGRTALSCGLLKEAKKAALALSAHLEGCEDPLIVLEPSCLSALVDDYPSLNIPPIKAIPLESFLSHLSIKTPIFYHPHCHEQVLSAPISLKQCFPQMVLSDAGCCGLAGAFGYESHHYEMSMAIAQNQLFKKIASYPDLPIVASGFSCRQQIAHGLNIKPLHPAEVLLTYS